MYTVGYNERQVYRTAEVVFYALGTRMSKKIKSAEEIQAIINAQIRESGLDPSFLVSRPVRLLDSYWVGPNWKLQDVPVGDVRQVSAAARIIKEVLANYSLSD